MGSGFRRIGIRHLCNKHFNFVAVNRKIQISGFDEDIVIETFNINKTISVRMGGDMAGISFGNLVMFLAWKRKWFGMHKMIFIGRGLNDRQPVTAIRILVNGSFFLQFVQHIPETRQLL